MPESKVEIAYIGLGANLGLRHETLSEALRRIDALAFTRVLRCSSFIENPARECDDAQPAYLNAVAEIEASLSAPELLAALLDIERSLGRVRSSRNAARTIDLDFLLFGDEVIETPELTLPHPRMWERDFVMGPLRELVGQTKIEDWMRRRRARLLDAE